MFAVALALLLAADPAADPARAELEQVAARIERLKGRKLAGEDVTPELERLLVRAQDLVQRIERAQRAEKVPASAEPGPSPEELRERADALRDERDRVVAELRELDARIVAVRRERCLPEGLRAGDGRRARPAGPGRAARAAHADGRRGRAVTGVGAPAARPAPSREGAAHRPSGGARGGGVRAGRRGEAARRDEIAPRDRTTMTCMLCSKANRFLATILAAAPLAAVAVEPATHAEATVGFDTSPLREASGEQGVYPFLGVILDAGLAYGGEKARLSAALSEGGRVFLSSAARDADMLASRLALEATWLAGGQGDVGAALALRDISERGGVRSETGGNLRVDSRVKVGRLDVETNGGLSVIFPRTSLLEDFASIGPDAGVALGFAPRTRQRLRFGWELRARRFPKWPTERWDVANGLVLDWSQRGTIIAGGGYGLTVNQSSVPGGAYVRSEEHTSELQSPTN